MTATVTDQIVHRVVMNGRVYGPFTQEELWALRTAIDVALQRLANPIDWKRIVSIVCRIGDVSWEDIFSKSRRQPLAFYRQIAMSLVYEHTGISYGSVGEKFGGLDHGTVLHAHRVVRGQRGTSKGNFIASVEAALQSEIDGAIAAQRTTNTSVATRMPAMAQIVGMKG